MDLYIHILIKKWMCPDISSQDLRQLDSRERPLTLLILCGRVGELDCIKEKEWCATEVVILDLSSYFIAYLNITGTGKPQEHAFPVNSFEGVSTGQFPGDVIVCYFWRKVCLSVCSV